MDRFVKQFPYYHVAEKPETHVDVEWVQRRVSDYDEVLKCLVCKRHPTEEIWVILYTLVPERLHRLRRTALRIFQLKGLSWAISNCKPFDLPEKRPSAAEQAPIAQVLDPHMTELLKNRCNIVQARIGYRYRNDTLDTSEICFQIVVTTKGAIPFGDTPLPKSIAGIPLDVMSGWPRVASSF